MNNYYPNLFSPIKMNQTVLKNRIVATPTGFTDIQEFDGPAYAIKGSMGLDCPSAMWGPINYAFSKYNVDDTHDWVIKAHSKGMKAGAELLHSGNQARAVETPYVFGPSAGKNDEGYTIKEMDEADMEMIAKAYAKAAVDSRNLGFDIIFMHFGHGWLPAQFLSPLHNHRTDEYGGSLENRAKFPLMILREVRKAVGRFFPIDMRISSVEHVEGSISFEDTLAFIGMAKEYIDAVHISCGLDRGCDYKGNSYSATPIFEPQELNVEYAGKVKAAYPDLIVGVVGAIKNPERAEKILAEGKADLICLGRALIADPAWARKAREGRSEDIRPCVRCLQCYHISTKYRNIGCTVNPRFHHHAYIPKDEDIVKNEVAKKVVVVGAGPAGIHAALAAQKKGNDVIVLEKSDRAGGMMNYIITEHYKEDMREYYTYLMRLFANSGIEVRYNTEATVELVASLKPDYLIVAVGSEVKNPPVKGLDLPKVHDCLNAIKNYDSLGNELVVIGGGSIGMEIALGAAEKDGKKVTVIEMAPDIALNASFLYQVGIRQHIEKCENLTIHTSAMCKEITENGVIFVKDGQQYEISYDDVVVASGMGPKTNLANSFFGICDETAIIGDCNSVRLIQEASLEGTMAGLNCK